MPRSLAKLLAIISLVLLFGGTITYLCIIFWGFASMLLSTAPK